MIRKNNAKRSAGKLLQELTSGAQEIGLCMYKIQMHRGKVTSKPGGRQISRVLYPADCTDQAQMNWC